MNDQERERLNLATRLAEKAEADWKQEAEKAREIAHQKGLDQPAIDRAVKNFRYPAIRTDTPPAPEP